MPAPPRPRNPPPLPDEAGIKAAIRDEALRIGFCDIGFAPATADTANRVLQKERLETFLSGGLHGDMDWLATHAERRAAPDALWAEARTVVSLAFNYAPDHDPLDTLARRDRAAISVYAQGRDYHDVVKGRLKQLGRFIHDRFGMALKVFVDTAPVMEKPAAERAGLGWQGKHTNLVSRKFGSWLFLGEILLAQALPADDAETDHCGSCRACLDICPTAAFPAPYRLDPRRCISYLTIEHKGPIPRELRAAMGNRIYGCDDCLAVCPWNKFAQVARDSARDAALTPRTALAAPKLVELAALDDQAFRRLFPGTAIKRTGRDRFVRNVAIALGNCGDAAVGVPALERLLGDASPLVRGAAVWALSRLVNEAAFATIRSGRLSSETDPAVLAEWHAGGAEAPRVDTPLRPSGTSPLAGEGK